MPHKKNTTYYLKVYVTPFSKAIILTEQKSCPPLKVVHCEAIHILGVHCFYFVFVGWGGGGGGGGGLALFNRKQSFSV